MTARLSFVFLGLSITSSWGNGHATTYRALLRELASRGHRVLFLERAAPWYQSNADLPDPQFCETALYSSTDELYTHFGSAIAAADATILGSYVPQGHEIAEFVTTTCPNVCAFYDIDTPVTFAALERGDCEYLQASDVPRFDLYLSFSGGGILDQIQKSLGAKNAKPLYCSVDTALYYPQETTPLWELGYLGTYSSDRQKTLECLLFEPARRRPEQRFIVGGPLYPSDIVWPENVEHLDHIAPSQHRHFYSSQRYTLNVTRRDMTSAGYSPSVRLFEAAACGVPIISDPWPGMELFFEPGKEILLASDTAQVLDVLARLSESERRSIASRARARVLCEHTAAHRAATLENYVLDVLREKPTSTARFARKNRPASQRGHRPRSEVKDEIL